MTPEEQARLSLHQRNSQEFYNKGSYVQARQQAEMALSFDEDSVGMRLMQGFCLVKLGTASRDSQLLDQAVQVFEGLRASEGDDDYRVWLGSGQAHLARALAYEDEMGVHERRLASDYLDADGRAAAQQQLDEGRRRRDEQLALAERTLARVFTFELQKDNTYALIEMVLVLNTLGGRELDALSMAQRAVDQLLQSNALTQATLQKNVHLSESGKLLLERRIAENLDKEQQLRGIVATIEWNRGELQSALTELDTLQERQLMRAVHYQMRATIHEQLGNLDAAVTDLQAFLKLRAPEREFDEVAVATFDRIDELVARGAVRPAP
jgi:tetratricopeptide (TPR) repeat protein